MLWWHTIRELFTFLQDWQSRLSQTWRYAFLDALRDLQSCCDHLILNKVKCCSLCGQGQRNWTKRCWAWPNLRYSTPLLSILSCQSKPQDAIESHLLAEIFRGSLHFYIWATILLHAEIHRLWIKSRTKCSQLPSNLILYWNCLLDLALALSSLGIFRIHMFVVAYVSEFCL